MAFKRVTLSLNEDADKELERIATMTKNTRSEVTRGAIFFLGKLSPESIQRILNQYSKRVKD